MVRSKGEEAKGVHEGRKSRPPRFDWVRIKHRPRHLVFLSKNASKKARPPPAPMPGDCSVSIFFLLLRLQINKLKRNIHLRERD